MPTIYACAATKGQSGPTKPDAGLSNGHAQHREADVQRSLAPTRPGHAEWSYRAYDKRPSTRRKALPEPGDAVSAASLYNHLKICETGRHFLGATYLKTRSSDHLPTAGSASLPARYGPPNRLEAGQATRHIRRLIALFHDEHALHDRKNFRRMPKLHASCPEFRHSTQG
ncbi:hypothetical protein [Tropicimonas sediminicola]|uniref:hypothetical protein n=1 Tax=Tropicimonas sediminicola TaxID=1031541 RepID=UPI001131D064|nr:hypothetical protein [Tropicimonas sediminicola]